MNALSKAQVEVISFEMEKALETVAANHGLKLEMGAGSFSSTVFNKKISFKMISDDGIDLAGKKMFEAWAFTYGLKPEMFGKKFLDNAGQTLQIVGLATRRPKFPVDLINVKTGEELKAPASFVNRWFNN